MAFSFVTENLKIGLDTPLGPDKFFVRQVWVEEGLSRLFHVELDLLADDAEVDLDGMLGASVTLRTALACGETAYFNGVVSRFRQAGETIELTAYRAEIVPSLWMLSREVDSRIFQYMTVPEIVQKVIDDSGVKVELEDKLTASYTQREYCVQYQETDFHFISRLMEEEGIFYFFTHGDGKHTMVLADSPDAHPACAEESEFELLRSSSARSTQDYVLDFDVERSIGIGVYTATDYNFQSPSTDLLVTQKGKDAPEFFEFPGNYQDRSSGERLSTVRLEEQEWQRHVVTGVSECRAFRSGHTFDLKKHYRSSYDGTYLLSRVRHAANQAGELSSRAGGEVGSMNYRAEFTAIPTDHPFRPLRTTPKPRIYGTQTAVVTGKAGEEIFTDKYGRVKVHFFWDREGKRDDRSSCFIRCAYGVSGKTWGQIFIPRIGQEVLVAFLEGDPDRPIIIGGVYNDEQMPPYTLPGEATKSTIKSRSSKGGATSNFNEFRLEDKKGSEEIYLQAEKDYNLLTKHDRAESVGNDRSLSVGHDKSESVGNNKSIEVSVNHDEKIGASKSLTVGASHTESIGSAMTINVGTMLTETVGINYAETVGAAMELTIGAVMTETIGAAKIQTIGATHTVSVGSNEKVTVGGNRTDGVTGGITQTIGKDLDQAVSGAHKEKVTKEYDLSAKKVSVTAEDQIVLKTGSSVITMKSDGTINIKGTKITVEGTQKIEEKAMNIKSEASTKNEIKGAMVTVEASGINTIKGSLVKIN